MKQPTAQPSIHVALDGSALRYPPSGIRTYLDSLIAEFRALPHDLRLSVVDQGRGQTPRLEKYSRLAQLSERLHRGRWDLFAVDRAAKAAQPDLLHIPKFSGPLKTRLPLVITIHDLIPLMLPEYRRSWWARQQTSLASKAAQGAVQIIVPSQFVASEVARLLEIDDGKLSVIPMGVSNRFRPPGPGIDSPEQWPAPIAPGERYIFNVGGFDVRKNLPTLLEAFKMALPKLGAGWKVVLAGAPHTGNAAVFPPLGPVIARLGLQNQVVLTGRITESEKIALYQRASLYVTASNYEGFGLTLLEAMACGVPVIASNTTSLPEVAGGAARLVEPGADAMAQAITEICLDIDRASRMREAGLARAEQFTWRQTALKTLEVYRRAVQQN